jgi:hypothetical protein
MDFIIVSKLQDFGQCWSSVPVVHVHVKERVKSLILPRYASVVGFISLEQTFSLRE